MKKYKLLQEFAFDIPNVGGSVIYNAGTIIEGEFQQASDAEAGTGRIVFVLPTEGGEPVMVSVPSDSVEEVKETSYNWLYLAAAGALVFWFVTRDKKRKPEAIPGF